jgi:hypothetical protein
VSAPAAKEMALAEAGFESDDSDDNSGQEDRSIDSNVSSAG